MSGIHFKGARETIEVKALAKLPQDRGKVMHVPFYCKFKVPKANAAKQLIKDAEDDKIDDMQVFDEYLVSWSDLKDVNEEPIEFSQNALEELMEIGPYRRAITNAFLEVMFGREALRQKN